MLPLRWAGRHYCMSDETICTGSAVLLTKPWDAAVWANGAQVVGLVQPRPLERWPPLQGVPVQTFHHSATTPVPWKMSEDEARRVTPRCTMFSARSRVQIPRGRSAFHVFNPAIMIVAICLFCLCCVLNHCKVAAIMLGVFGIFNLEIFHKGQLNKNADNATYIT